MAHPSARTRATPGRLQDARLLTPDLARGLMLALIAVANVMIYLHGRPYGLRQHIVEEGALDRIVTGVIVTTVDARAYPLFAALFGYGLVRTAQRQGRSTAGEDPSRDVLRRRSAFLMIFGLIHALAGFSGDVLGWYGLLGWVLASRLQLPDRALLILAGGWLTAASLVQGLVYADPQVRAQRTFLWSFAIEDPLQAAGWRLVEWAMTPFGLLSVLSPMLIGVWAARHRVLEQPEHHRRLLQRTAWVGVCGGLVGGAPMALATAGVWVPSTPVLLGLSWVHVFSGVCCGLGYAAAIALAVHRLGQQPHGQGLRRTVVALRSAGACSLSCYLAQSAVFVILLPAWSMGLGATLGTAQAAALALATWAGTVLLAWGWVRRGRRGPAESLLRHLMRNFDGRRPAAARATIG